MKCFNHQSLDAVASCKSCFRALCPNCVAPVGLSCSCRDRCEADVAALNDLFDRGRTAYQKGSAVQFQSGVFILLLGMPFLILGAVSVSGEAEGGFGYFSLLLGLVFVCWGIAQFSSARKINQK